MSFLLPEQQYNNITGVLAGISVKEQVAGAPAI